MTMSKPTELASARRKLRRIEEDEPAFQIRITGMTEAEQRMARRWFQDILGRQRKRVEQLEAELEGS
jgi:hypothetical protein